MGPLATEGCVYQAAVKLPLTPSGCIGRMARSLSITDLIEAQLQGTPPSEGSSALSRETIDSLPRWNALAAEIGEQFSELLCEQVLGAVELSMISEGEWRTSADKPGLLVAARRLTVRIPEAKARLVSDRLLRDTGDQGDSSVDSFDALSLAPLLAIVLDGIRRAFGIALPMPDLKQPQFRWPLEPPNPAKRILVEFQLTLDEGKQVPLQLLLPTDAVVAMRPKESTTPDTKHLNIGLPVEAVLGRWKANARELASLEPGMSLPIPGGSLGAINLSIPCANRSVDVGSGKLITVHNRHSVKIVSASTA